MHGHLDPVRSPAIEASLGPLGLAVLDALAAHAAILDAAGTICAVNSQWREFYRQVGGTDLRCGVGANYLQVCREGAESLAPRASQTLRDLQRLLAGEISSFEIHYPCHGPQEPRWFIGRFSRFQLNQSAYVLVTHELAHLDSASKETFEKLSLAVRRTSNGVILMDANGAVEWVNEAFTRTTGFDCNEVLGRKFWSLLPNTGADGRCLQRIQRALEKRTATSVTMRNSRSDGSLFWAELRIDPVCNECGEVENIVGLQIDITQRRRLEQEVADSARTERQRLARDLHDGLGQELTGARFLIDSAIAQIDANSAAICSLADASQAIQRSMSEVRLLARGLAPSALAGGLASALTSLAAHMSLPGRLMVRFTKSGTSDLSPETAEQLYRISQEAVANAAQHGGATEIQMTLRASGDFIELKISDNGCGFSPDADPAGSGLRVMRYRADLINGELAICSSPKHGTVITCSAPV